MSRDKARFNDNWDDEARQDPYHVPTLPPRRPSSRPQPRRSPEPRPRLRKRRRVWTWLLMGCAGGIVILVVAAAITVFLTIRSATGGGIIPAFTNSSGTYTQASSPQPIQICTITQREVHDPITQVAVTVDPS